MNNTRCEEIIVQLIVRTYDDAGRPLHEDVSAPTKVFRNPKTRDFWAHCDESVAAMLQQQRTAMQSPADPPAPKKAAKGK